MISATLGALLLAAVFAAFLFMGRSGANLQNYADMEAQGRRAIETFAQDVRMAKNAEWKSARSLTLTVITSAGADQERTYTYDPVASTFTRITPTGTTILLTGISEFVFTAYQIDTTAIDLTTTALADASKVTKQVQISLSTVRSTRTVADATNSVISARFILRNKRVTA
jgi:hypothetical protein